MKAFRSPLPTHTLTSFSTSSPSLLDQHQLILDQLVDLTQAFAPIVQIHDHEYPWLFEAYTSFQAIHDYVLKNINRENHLFQHALTEPFEVTSTQVLSESFQSLQWSHVLFQSDWKHFQSLVQTLPPTHVCTAWEELEQRLRQWDWLLQQHFIHESKSWNSWIHSLPEPGGVL